MKMAKASEADLKMAMELCSALESLMRYGHMPCDGEHDEPADFDPDSAQDCERALRALFDIAETGSLMRVVWGMAVLLDPANEIVDPDSDVLEHHPKYGAAPDILAALREAREALQLANDSPGGGINDTIWMPHRPETLFDFLDASIAKAEGRAA